MKQKLTIILMLAFCFISQMSAQTLNVYYSNEKTYEDAVQNGLNVQSKNGKFGFINSKGKFVIKPIFDEVTAFQNNLSIVKYNGKWGVIDLHGNTVIEPEYTNKPQHLKYKGYDVTQCIMFQNDSKPIGILSYVDGGNIIIDIKKYIHKEGQDFFITETRESRNSGLIYGRTYSIDAEGKSIIFDAINDITNTDWIIFIKENTTFAINTKSNDGGAIPEGYEFLKTTETGVIFDKQDPRGWESARGFLYYDYSAGDFNWIESHNGDIKEFVYGDLTYICYNSGGYGTAFAVLKNSNNKAIAIDVEKIEKYENGEFRYICGKHDSWMKESRFDGDYEYILLTQYDNTNTLIKKDGTFITGGNASYEFISKYLICNYGEVCSIMDMNGENLLPIKLNVKREDIIIENDSSYLICVESYDNKYEKNPDKKTMVFASSNGWYEEVQITNKDKIRNTFNNMMLNTEVDTINISSMSSTIPSSYNNTHDYYYTYKWFEEEEVDGRTYTQPIHMFFYNGKYNKEKYIEKLEQKNGRYSKDLGVFDIYIIRKVNENGKFYLKVKESEFELDGLLLDSWFNCCKILPNHLAVLSDGKVLFSFGVDYEYRNLIYTMENKSTIYLFDPKKPTPQKTIKLTKHEEYENICVSKDGFYLYSSSFIAKYNNDGECIWDFGFKKEEFFSDFDENDKYVMITGYNTVEKYYAKPNPMTVILNKQTGEIVKRNVENYMINGNVNHYWTNITSFENGYLLQRMHKDYNGDEIIDAAKVIRLKE